MLAPCTLWVDPGGMTGLAALFNPAWDGPLQFQAMEKPFYEACQQIELMASYYYDRLAIGWERFTINSRTHQKTPQPDALHVIGVCRYLVQKYGCRLLPEAQQHTPSKQEQERLKAIGWWVPGQDDAQSAACHLLAWLAQTGEIPPREAEILNALQGE